VPFSISGFGSPSFHSRVHRKRRENVARFPRSLTLGFGYPLDEMAWLPNPGGSLSTPNALGLRSSELFSSRVIEKPSRILLSAPALRLKTFTTLNRCSSGLIPPRKPCPSSLPKCLARVGTSCSLELSNLSGSPSLDAHVRGFSTLTFPSRSYEAPTLRFGTPMNLRVFKHRQLGSLPITGRRPVWPS